MTNYDTVDTHINTIRAGDTVLHNGELRTVCNSDIKRRGFMGAAPAKLHSCPVVADYTMQNPLAADAQGRR